MNFHELSLPQSKKFSADCTFKEFPIDRIPAKDTDKQFTGIFNGLSVEIIDADAMRQLYSNGCFGLSSKTKNVPQMLYNCPRVPSVTQSQYEQKSAWNDKFTNQNPNLVMMNLLQPAEKTTVETTEGDQIDEEVEEIEEMIDAEEEIKVDEGENNDEDEENQPIQCDEVNENPNQPTIFETKKEPELNLVVDPFPIEDTLALFPEEAFFLHFSLRCLNILDFDQTHTFTTEEAVEKFCNMNPKFIERYIVYHFYRSKSWVVRSGLKFGGDFLLYYKGPSYYHASYVVLVSDSKDETNKLDMQSNYRVADTTKKELILASITRPNGLEYSNQTECLKRLNEFQITEIIPKRFTLSQLTSTKPEPISKSYEFCM
ncbi:tRNA-splicing endonuclease subunit Sen2 [Sitodiplosis mosellana]|uniref:tRNA-splicing endonuclease subunit Sen2 n=1 Tax=Sitodiplosis mosellana TaxID=263140 RepID=UPI002443A337|nr:tRNA-splicing endonuclease subunit Sen2 [Sitodiplosis mosellana]